MKKHIYITLLILCFSLSSFAQKNREKMQALKIAYITDDLELTPNEAEKFWPIYNNHQSKKEALRKTELKDKLKANLDDLSETEAKNFINNILNLEAKKALLHEQYIKELMTVIPSKKIIKLMQTERNFKLKMINEYKGRLRDRRNRQ